MKSRIKSAITFILPLGDFFAITLSVISAYYLRFFVEVVPVKYGVPEFKIYLAAVPVIAAVYMLAMNYAGLYVNSVIRARIDSFFKVASAITAGTVILLASTFFIRSFTFSRVVMVFLLIMALFYVYVWRLIYRAIFDYLARKNLIIRNILIIGATKVSAMLIERLNRDMAAGYRVAGCVDDRMKKGKIFAGVKILGRIKQAPEIIKNRSCDEVFIGIEDYSRKETAELIMSNDNVKFMIASDILGLMTKTIEYDEMFGIPIFSVKELPLNKPLNRFFKRATDITGSLTGIIILSPVLICLSVLVKLSSPGPVFYSQERVGRHNKNFRMYKFRSMRADAEVKTGPKWAAENDPRRTAIGTFMRKTSLDELPQLFNILLGDMSIVGPRPERPHFVKEFSKTIPRYLERHRVKSGLTGWAQVHGLRGNTSLEERINYDLYYIENWSLWLDVKIVIKTALEVFHHKTAY